MPKEHRINKDRLATERVISANKASDSQEGNGPNIGRQVSGVYKAIKSGTISPKTLTDSIFPKEISRGKQ